MAIKSAFNAAFKKDIFANSDANLMSRLFDAKALDGHTNIDKARGVLNARKETMTNTKSEIEKARTTIADNRKMMDGLDKDSDDFKALQTQIASREDVIKAQTKKQSDVGLMKTYGDVAGHAWGAMNAGSAGQIATKWGAVGAGYMALNAAGRGLSGGGATYNSSGQRDIMGVPLI